MELFTSFRLLVFGVLKRLYWLAPALLSDPFDIAERLFRVMYQPPDWLLWVLILIGFAFAITLTYHELRTQKIDVDRQVRKQLAAKPAITVSCETDYGNLKIRNYGHTAEFLAKAQRLENGQPIGDEWFVKWKDSPRIEQTIFEGDNNTLEVASCEWLSRDKNGKTTEPFICFHTIKKFVTADLAEQVYSSHESLPPRYKRVEIEISIFSQPGLRSPFKQRYLLKLIPDEDTVSIMEHNNEM